MINHIGNKRTQSFSDRTITHKIHLKTGYISLWPSMSSVVLFPLFYQRIRSRSLLQLIRNTGTRMSESLLCTIKVGRRYWGRGWAHRQISIWVLNQTRMPHITHPHAHTPHAIASIHRIVQAHNLGVFHRTCHFYLSLPYPILSYYAMVLARLPMLRTSDWLWVRYTNNLP